MIRGMSVHLLTVQTCPLLWVHGSFHNKISGKKNELTLLDTVTEKIYCFSNVFSSGHYSNSFYEKLLFLFSFFNVDHF